MKLVVDTSAYSAFNRGDERLKKWLSPKNGIIVPLIVVGELRAGFAVGSKSAENERLLRRFLDSISVNTVSISDATTEQYASVYRQLRRGGRPIGTNDMWIAATAIEHSAPLLTLDSDYAHVAGLDIIKL